MGIRSTAKAIVLNGGKILLNKCFDKNNGYYYSLVGGGQEMYETLNETVVREVLEETGYTAKPEKFAGLCELICDDEDFRARRPDYAHKMYHIFVCSLENVPKKEPTEKDSAEEDSVWVPISDIENYRILPKCVNDNLKKMIESDNALFIGSCHLKYNNG